MKTTKTRVESTRLFVFNDSAYEDVLGSDACLAFREQKRRDKSIGLTLSDTHSYMFGSPASVAEALESLAAAIREHYKVIA